MASQDALAAYNGMMADWDQASKTSNYQDPALAKHMSGKALSQVVRGIAAAKYAGIAFKGQSIDTPHVTQLSPADAPTQALVVSCSDGTHWIGYKVADGSVVDTGPNGRHRVEALVEDVDGVWKVSVLRVLAVGTC